MSGWKAKWGTRAIHLPGRDEVCGLPEPRTAGGAGKGDDIVFIEGKKKIPRQNYRDGGRKRVFSRRFRISVDHSISYGRQIRARRLEKRRKRAGGRYSAIDSTWIRRIQFTKSLAEGYN